MDLGLCRNGQTKTILLDHNYCIAIRLQNLSDYNQFLYIKSFEVNKKQIFSVEKVRNSGKSEKSNALIWLNNLLDMNTTIFSVSRIQLIILFMIKCI